MADADDLALDDTERVLAADILPKARGVLSQIETAIKDGVADKALRLEKRAADIDGQARDGEFSPAGMAARARSLEREIQEVESQAGSHGDAALSPEVQTRLSKSARHCRPAHATVKGDFHHAPPPGKTATTFPMHGQTC